MLTLFFFCFSPDPLKPKGRVMAYSFFLKAYAKEHNITKVTELGKAVGAAWKSMSPQERTKYEQLDREDKVRYEREREVYLKNKGGYHAAQALLAALPLLL